MLLRAEQSKSSRNKAPFWFATPDQKAQRLFDKGEFHKSAELFADPARQGSAWYRADEFKKAAAAFGRTGTPEGLFNRGNAFVMSGNYEAAISSYRQTLKERANWKPAEENLALAKVRLANLQPPDDAVSQKAVGEDDEPDEIVFDDRAKNQENANTETIAGEGEEISDMALRAMWLRKVETSPSDFLKLKFSFQHAKRKVRSENGDI